ncbi:hypothetical protein HPB50_005267 [Hyalomma asiaticum]|uniref:Uncharacterized protein n=1 Tax=Hyalomma asiaticum TaxID=266040 RepID=A0ACB7T0S0_HYAAI|nr:hypothetical protein HPB50_005267 [Hyalomma asiaticum]
MESATSSTTTSLLLRPEDTFMGTFTNAYLKPIFDAAKESNVTHNTQFGMSIHAPAINDFSAEVKSTSGMQHYKDHWQHKINHWGVVNIHELLVKNSPDILKTSLTVLKELKDVATAAGKNSSMVVGLFCKSAGGCDVVTEYLKTVYLPDGILVLGHLSYNDNNITDCTIMPVSILEHSKYNISYMHTLEDSIDTVRYLQAEGLDTMYAVTMTMAGRWYKPRRPDNQNVLYPGKYRVGYLCKLEGYPQKAHVQDVCGNKSLEFTDHFQYTAHHLCGFAWDKKAGLTVTFDTLEAIQIKICYAFENNTQLLVGLSVYDANYDAAPRNCKFFGGAPWSRMQWIERTRKMLNVPKPYEPGQFSIKCLHALHQNNGFVLTGPALPRYTTVCTVSYLAFGLPLPLTGECDIIYYDSLLLRPEDTFMGTFTNAYLKPIYDAAKESNVNHNTEFGMSIHAPAINDFSAEVKTAAGLHHYKDHWKHRIYHWGVLNIHELIMNSTPDMLKTSLHRTKGAEGHCNSSE